MKYSDTMYIQSSLNVERFQQLYEETEFIYISTFKPQTLFQQHKLIKKKTFNQINTHL